MVGLGDAGSRGDFGELRANIDIDSSCGTLAMNDDRFIVDHVHLNERCFHVCDVVDGWSQRGVREVDGHGGGLVSAASSTCASSVSTQVFMSASGRCLCWCSRVVATGLELMARVDKNPVSEVPECA